MFASQARLISFGLLGLALLILGWALYGTVQTVLFHSSLRTAPPPQQAAARVKPVTSGYKVKQIVNAHLFGRAQARETTSRVTQAPQTKLRLALLGVVASNKPEFARAVIGVNAASGKNYAVGDKIAGTDATLHAVEKSRVILDRNGQYESLKMIREVLDDKTPRQMARAPVTLSAPIRATERASPASAQPGPQKKKFPF